MECVTTTSTIHEVGDIIAVECKWRSKIGFYLDIKDIEKYEGYMNSNLLNRPIKTCFMFLALDGVVTVRNLFM